MSFDTFAGVLLVVAVAAAASQQQAGGDYYYTGDSHYVGFHGSNSRQFPSALGFRGTPIPGFQQEQYLQSSQPTAYQLPPTYDPYLQSQVQNQVRTGQTGFHTNQHLPQPFHPPSRRFPLTSNDEQTLDFGTGGAFQEIVRPASDRGAAAPSYQQPPSRPSPTAPQPNSYQEIVRSTGSSFFPSSLVDQLDSNRWRSSNTGSKRKPPATVALPPPVEEAQEDANSLPGVSSTSAYFSGQDERDSSSPTSRGRSRYKNIRVESTPFTIATPSSTFGPSRFEASRTRRPLEVRRATSVRPTTLRPTARSTLSTTTTTTEAPHYDPDYELEYILEPEDEGLQEELPALLGPNNNITSLPLSAPVIRNLKFEEDLSAAFLPPGYRKDNPTTTTEPPITTFVPKARVTQGSPTTRRPTTTTTTTTTPAPTTKPPLPTKAASLSPPPGPDHDNSSESPTESWIVVASVQTSRSVSGARFLPGQVVKQEETQKPLSPNGTIIEKAEDSGDKPATPSTPAPSPSSTKGSTESIIDKLDRVQSDLSSSILSGFRPGDSKLDIPDMHENKTVAEALTTMEVPKSTETSTAASTTTEATTPKPRTFVPSGKRTTLKPKKSILESIHFEEVTTGLVPSNFKPRESTFRPKTSSREGSGRSAGSTFKNNVKEESKSSGNKTLESILGKISFDDVSPGYDTKAEGGKAPKISKQEAPASLLPPGFKPKIKPAIVKEDEIPESLLPPGFKKEKSKSPASDEKKDPAESILKKIAFKDVSALLPPGFKEKDNVDTELAGLLPPGFKVNKTESETTTESTTENKPVFPSRPGGARKPPPSRTKSGGGLAPPPPKIQKGWPVRASTEFTGWPSSSTTPVSIEKILERAKQESAKILEYNRLATSTDAPASTRESVTVTARTTTTRQPTTPGVCERDCDMAATLRLVGGAKWVPELLDHNTLEWQQLANEVESQLEAVYSSSESLSKWYKKITIDAFSEGSVLVDYFVELTELGRTVNTAEMKRLFHESLGKYTASQAALAGDTKAATNTNNQTEFHLGKFVIDPNYTDFIVLPRQVMPTVGYAEEDELLPQWAIAVIVIGLASLLFVIIFGVTVLVNRHKSSKKKQPTVLTEDMLSELNKNHMGGLDNFGADDLYNMEDVWADKPVNKRSSGSIQENSMANLYDSWRSEWNGYYYNAYYGNGQSMQLPSSHRSSGGGGGGGYGLGRRRSDYDTNF